MSETPTQPVKKREPVGITYATTPRSWRRRLATELRSWSRTTFNRESYLSSLRSLLWVVPLTVLIWVYAEREQVTTLRNVTISVDPPPGQRDRLVRFSNDTPHTIHAEVRGPQAAAEQMKELLESTAIALDLEGNLTPGEHQINVARSLNRDSRVVAKGMEIQNCVPPVVTVVVDAIVESDAEVRARPQDVPAGPRPPVFTPSTVKIRAPQASLDAAGKEGKLFVYANLSPFKAALAEPGSHPLTGVPLSPAFEAPAGSVTIAPITVDAQVEVPKLGTSYTIPALAVYAAYPKTHQSELYEAEYQTPINQVQVVGPDDKIAGLRDGTITARAMFVVSFDDLNSPRPAVLAYDLPPGVRVVEVDPSKPRTITYTLKPRSVPDK